MVFCSQTPRHACYNKNQFSNWEAIFASDVPISMNHSLIDYA